MLVSIKIGDRELSLKTNVLENQDEIDLDRILKLDHNHLMAEALTFSVVLNKLGLLMIEAENKVKEAKLDLEIWYSKKKDEVRKNWDEDEERKVVRGYKYTIDQVTDAVESSSVYKMKKKTIIDLERTAGYLNTIYWSAKSKDQRLSALMGEVAKEEIDVDDLIGKKFNGVLISSKKQLMP